MIYLKALIALWPVIRSILSRYASTPEEKRAALVSDLAKAFDHAEDTDGDTSQIEDIIRRGR